MRGDAGQGTGGVAHFMAVGKNIVFLFREADGMFSRIEVKGEEEQLQKEKKHNTHKKM